MVGALSARLLERCRRHGRVLLGALLTIVVAVRLVGLNTHVTYIDELLVLTSGRWSAAEAPDNAPSLFHFLQHLLWSDQCSYAPGQFALTYLLLPAKQLSLGGVIAGRLVSVFVFAVGAVCGVLALRRSAQDQGLVASAVFLVLIGCSAMSLTNSQQMHSYIAGLSGVLAGALVVVTLLSSEHVVHRMAGAVVLCVAPFLSYQLVLVTAAGGAVLLLVSVRGLTRGAWLSAAVNIALVLAMAGASLVWLGWLGASKGALQIAWWVQPWMITPAAPLAMLGDALAKTVNVFGAVMAFPGVPAPVFAVLGALATAAGCCLAVFSDRDSTRLLAQYAVGFIGLVVVAAIAGKVPLSPSRHSLVVLPAVALLCGLSVDAAAGALCRFGRAWSDAWKVVSVVLTLLAGVYALAQFHTQRAARAEAFDANLIIQTMEAHDLDTVATSYWDYSKVAMLMAEADAQPHTLVGAINAEATYPHGRFLLVGQNPRLFPALFDLKESDGYTQVKVYALEKKYDFEPSAEIEYWPNEFHMWVVERR